MLLAQREALALAQARLRLRVDLGDVDALRADLGADAAARAVVDRGVGRPARRCGSARPAGRRTSARGTAASRSRTGTPSRRSCTSRSGPATRASPRTGRRVIGQLSAPASISSAARCPLARLTPSPDFSFQGCAPASVAPATSTLSRTRAPVGVDRAQPVVDGDAGARERMLAEVVGAEARLARRRHAVHRQPERGLARVPVRVELDAAARDPAGGEHDPPCAVVDLAPRGGRADRVDAAVRRARARTASEFRTIRPPARRSRVAQRLEDPHAGHRRRQRRDLEDRPAELLLQVASRRRAGPRRRAPAGKPTRCRAVEPRARPDGRSAARELGVLHRPREPEAVGLRAAVDAPARSRPTAPARRRGRRCRRGRRRGSRAARGSRRRASARRRAGRPRPSSRGRPRSASGAPTVVGSTTFSPRSPR